MHIATDYSGNKLTALAAVVALSGGLAACGGGSSKKADMPDPPPPPPPTAQEMCEDADGRWNADTMTCTTAEQLAAMVAAATKAAGTKAKAIAAEAAQTTDAGLGGTARTDANESTTEVTDDVYGLDISRDRDGTTVKITDPANAADDDPMFMELMGDNGMSMQSRTMEADDDGNVMTEIVMVMTDIDEPTATPFADVAGQALNHGDTDTSVDADGDGTPDNDHSNLIVGADITTAPVADTLKLVMSDSFVGISGRSTTLSFDYAQDDGDPDTPGVQPVEAAKVAGTYNGADGMYLCASASADCTVTIDGEGAISGMSAGWVFTPAMGAKSDVADADYLHYGFWLKRTADADGAITYNEIETFAGSSVDPSDGTVLNTVAGSASYSGGATGVYVYNTLNPDGTTDSSTSGFFSADASLTAIFGQVAVSATDSNGTIAANMLNTVSGTIDNFVLQHGESNNWSVALAGTRADGANTFTGTAKGGVGDGSLSGTYYGPVTADTGAHLEENDSVYPSSVGGEFNAGFTNGSVAGAFGVSQDEE